MSTLWQNIFKSGGKRDQGERVLAILKRIPVFEDLSRRELASVERILHRREYESDEVVFYQEDPGVGMYIVQEGSVAIVSEPSGQVLAQLGGGEFFGEMALLDDSPRSATAVCKAPSRLLVFFQADLFGLVEREPRLGVKIMTRLARVIAERLRRTLLLVQPAAPTASGDREAEPTRE
jgi:CRP-like cAMP-binding protein